MILGHGQDITLTLNTHTFIYPLSCLHLPTFMSQAATVYEKSNAFTFSDRKAYVAKFDLALKKVMVNLGSSFEKTMTSPSPIYYKPSFMEIDPVPEKIFEVFFLPYMG